MRRALAARPRPWREFKVGDQVAFWRKGKGRGMRFGHARWHGRAIVLALCPGSKNVWIAYGHQLLKVSQEQLRMATITESVADDVRRYLDMSRDPLPPSVDESTQTSPEERAERHDRFENRGSGPVAPERSAQSSGSGAQASSAQPRNTEDPVHEDENQRRRGVHGLIGGLLEKELLDETPSSAKKERVESTDLSLVRSPSELPLPSSGDAMVRLRDNRQADHSPDEQGKRVRACCGSRLS